MELPEHPYPCPPATLSRLQAPVRPCGRAGPRAAGRPCGPAAGADAPAGGKGSGVLPDRLYLGCRE